MEAGVAGNSPCCLTNKNHTQCRNEYPLNKMIQTIDTFSNVLLIVAALFILIGMLLTGNLSGFGMPVVINNHSELLFFFEILEFIGKHSLYLILIWRGIYLSLTVGVKFFYVTELIAGVLIASMFMMLSALIVSIQDKSIPALQLDAFVIILLFSLVASSAIAVGIKHRK